MPRVLIAASGTGGHIFPALAVAEALPDEWDVLWVGVLDRLENELVPKKYQLQTIRGGAIQGNFTRKFWAIIGLLLSIFRIVYSIHREKIDVVFSTGGYIAAPAIIGAFLCNVPAVMHESNAEPGRAVKLLGRFCETVALGFFGASNKIKGCRTVFTGTPVRPSFLSTQALPKWVPSGNGPLLVVMGGSQGALGLNLMVRFITPKLLKEGCRIVHLTGVNDPNRHKIVHPNLVERTFTNEIPALLHNADLAISRAGASALSELSVCGTPAILIPFPQAKDKHQDINAMYFAKSGAALIVHQQSPESNALWDSISLLLNINSGEFSNCSEVLLEMKLAMKSIATLDADRKLAELLIHLTV